MILAESGLLHNLKHALFHPTPNRTADGIAIALVVLLVFLFFLPFFKDLNQLPESRDMAKFIDQMSLYRITVGDYHQLPLRTHLVGGGYQIIGHPYDFSFHPLAPLMLIFGERFVVRLNLLLLFLLGTLACYGLARRVLKFNLAGSVIACLAFTFCSWAPEQINDGNLGKLYSLLFPIILYSFHRAQKSPGWIFWGALAWFVVITNGALIFIPMALVFFAYVILIAVAGPKSGLLKRWGAGVLLASLILALGTCFSIGKLVPQMELFQQRVEPIHHDQEEDYEAISSKIVAPSPRRLLDGMLTTPWLHGKDWNVTFFFGYGALLLFLIAVVSQWRRQWPHILIIVILLLLTMGPAVSGFLYQALWEVVPGFRYMHKLSKFTLPYIVLFTALVIGGGLQRSPFAMMKKNEWMRWVLLLLAVTSIIQAFSASRWFLRDNFTIPLPEVRADDKFYQVYFQGFESRNLDFRKGGMGYISKQEYLLHLQHKGIINWTTNFILPEPAAPRYFLDASETKKYTPVSVAAGVPNPGYSGEVFFKNSKGKARLVRMTPLAIDVEVEAVSGDIMVVNQNYHSGWKAAPYPVVNVEGLLGVVIEKQGRHNIYLTYLPVLHVTAILASLLFIVGSAMFFLLWSRRTAKSKRLAFELPDAPGKAAKHPRVGL